MTDAPPAADDGSPSPWGENKNAGREVAGETPVSSLASRPADVDWCIGSNDFATRVGNEGTYCTGCGMQSPETTDDGFVKLHPAGVSVLSQDAEEK